VVVVTQQPRQHLLCTKTAAAANILSNSNVSQRMLRIAHLATDEINNVFSDFFPLASGMRLTRLSVSTCLVIGQIGQRTRSADAKLPTPRAATGPLEQRVHGRPRVVEISCAKHYGGFEQPD
jgi:hypothetical protein